ncbi:MAG: O-antigen ligase family protein [Methylophilaceae bacterium]|nr:O-antigen ligase family protein [Methylophilaceae bacterium]
MNKNSNVIRLAQFNSIPARALVVCLTIFPLFLLVIRGWVGIVLILAFAISAYLLIRNKTKGLSISSENASRSNLFWLIATLASPIVSVFLAQLFRQDFSWRLYDGPAHILVCIPILIVMLQYRIDMGNLLSLAAPGAILFTLIEIIVNPHVIGDRVTTNFADLLTFGSLTLTLGLFSLVSINLYGTDSKAIKLFKLFGFVAGVYLSAISGSRTGWLAFPFILLFWLIFNGSKHKMFTTVIAIATAVMASIAAYYFSTTVQQRIDLGVSEVLTYHWNTLNPVSSVGDRISFFRIAWFLFLQNPLGGYDDAGFLTQVNAPELARFATQYTREFVFYHGFHNEITTSMVRSGIWGLLSSVALFLVPALFFTSRLTSASAPVNRLALLATCFIFCAFINSMSTEIFNLKYTASFYALMITCLAGSLMVVEKQSETSCDT